MDQKSAEKGDAIAQERLAYCLRNGIGVARDEKDTDEWVRKSRE